MEDCIFCRIIRGEIPSEKVFENENVLAFKDIQPQAPVHLLVIPKKHIESLAALTEDELPLAAELLSTVNALAKEFHLTNGYRVVTNIGDDARQSVHHLHFHLLGGEPMDEKMC